MDLGSIKPIENGLVNVLVEVPFGTIGAKYEFDKNSGFILLDRILKTPMHYPCSYGLIPNTKGGDGDELDVVLACSVPLHPGVLVSARPVGVLSMEDEGGQDDKIFAVVDCDDVYANVREHSDLPLLARQIEFFFLRYKELDSEKWSKVLGWSGSDRAWQLIESSI